MEELRDRYGAPPVPVLNLADYGRIRVMADELRVESIDREGSVVVVKFRDKARVDPVQVIKLVRERGDLQLIPPSTLKMDLKKGVEPEPPRAAEDARQKPRPGGPPGITFKPATPGIKRTREKREAAWWTARATAGEVTPGFSKAEILRPKAEDPRAPGGILQRVEELLEDLKESSGV
jgi:transcription-repair coupling factor (superfamily II helicase)